MAISKISEPVRQFIFEHIDSVEQLEVLLYLRNHTQDGCSAEHISKELRSSATSVAARLNNLRAHDIIIELEPSKFIYSTNNPYENVVKQLAEDFKVRKHLVLELIFSPLKEVKKFADSFVFGEKKKGEEEDG